MKSFKLFAVLCCVALGAWMMTSCESKNEPKEVTVAYSFSMSQFSSVSIGASDIDAREIVKAYLTSKGCLNDGEALQLLLVDENVEKCDEKAKAKFQTLVDGLSADELDQKLVSTTTTFTYRCARLAGSSDSGISYLVLGTWDYSNVK